LITHLKPYPKYKEPGELWLGMVPEHWELLPNRTLFKERKDRDYPDEEMLSVTITRGVIRQKDLLQNSSKKDSSNLDKSSYKLVSPNDIVYNKMRAWQGAIGVSQYRGIVSPAYVIVRPLNKCYPPYFHYLYRTPHFAKEAERWSYGITSDMWSLRPEHFKLIYSCLPPREEQEQIVRFLDYMDRRIRRYICEKQKLIKLLEEQKQVIIHQAVTRGLDPNVRMKPSGVEWLGDVPEHWEVQKLKHLVRINPSKSETKELPSGELVTFLPMEAVSRDGIIDCSKSISLREAISGYTYIRDGDVIIAKITPCFENGKGALCTGLMGGIGFGSTEFHVFRPSSLLLGEYLFYLTHDPVVRINGIEQMQGSAGQQRVPREYFANLNVPLPNLQEQKNIIDEIRDQSNKQNGTVLKTKREIDLLREYRTRLIADVVTGKLDVREIAAQLPDEFEKEEIMDEDEIILEDEEYSEDSYAEAEV